MARFPYTTRKLAREGGPSRFFGKRVRPKGLLTDMQAEFVRTLRDAGVKAGQPFRPTDHWLEWGPMHVVCVNLVKCGLAEVAGPTGQRRLTEAAFVKLKEWEEYVAAVQRQDPGGDAGEPAVQNLHGEEEVRGGAADGPPGG